MASSSSTPNPLTIPEMIKSLSNQHEQLSTALRMPSGDEIEETVESSAPIEQGTEPHIEKLLSRVKLLMEALGMIKDLDYKLNVPIQSINSSLDEVIGRIKEAPPGSLLTERIGREYLEAISKDIKTLKFQIPSYRKFSLAKTTAHLVDTGRGTLRQSEMRLPNLYADQVFEESSAFKQLRETYDGFTDDIWKKCFLYFAVFPENVELKKRFLTHWWIGEGLLDPSGSEDSTPENVAGGILKEFAEKGLIVPVKKEQKKVKKRFTMPPLVRSAAIKLAIEKGFSNYDSGDNPIGKTLGCDRIFLVKGGGSHPPRAPPPPTTTGGQKLEETIKTIFNVSQPFPDSALEWLAKKGEVDMRTEKVVEWLLKLRNLEVLYLGRWQGAADEQVIEVESLEFLKGLKKMKKMRLLSLQGIFSINKLPNSIRTLSELRVLDLKCCYNLEKLPEGIGSLKRLTHLDVNGCYMLNQMPKSISRLTELRVLKGFVTGKSSLNNLKGLKKLRKLSINTSRHDFPNETDLWVLRDLGEHGELRNLTIEWGAEGVKQPPPDTGKGNIRQQLTKQFSKRKPTTPPNDETSELPKELEKLEMECLPRENLPLWLNPLNLTSLKKLYIRGGKLAELGNKPWSAEVVRLKYITELKIEWRELLKSFPNLSYLQKVKCPRITFCPCDANGVWMKR